LGIHQILITRGRADYY